MGQVQSHAEPEQSFGKMREKLEPGLPQNEEVVWMCLFELLLSFSQVAHAAITWTWGSPTTGPSPKGALDQHFCRPWNKLFFSQTFLQSHLDVFPFLFPLNMW